MNSKNPLVVIVAGGTGGHLYPGVAMARELQTVENCDILFIVRQNDKGKEVLRREKFSVAELKGQGLPRSFSLSALLFPFKLIAGFLGAYVLLSQTRPRVVLGMGGYLTFPVLLAARLLGIRCVIHEQNVFPGLANRWSARFADQVAISFDESRRYFPSGKTRLTGLPVRQTIGAVARESGLATFHLSGQTFTFLIFGGSQGAHRLNVMTLESWRLLMSYYANFQVVHITGEKDYDYVRALYRGFSFRSAVLPYCHQMAEAYAAADVVVCRAGASTVAEVIAARKPAVFVPYPHASNDHQRFNAEVLCRRNLAEMIQERSLTPETLAKSLAGYLSNPEKLFAVRSAYAHVTLPSVGQEAARKLASLMR